MMPTDTKPPARAKRRGSLAAALLALALALALPASAPAAIPPLLWQSSGGAQGIGVDQSTGHLFVADGSNARVVELDAWGEFVKAWGWEVVASGPGDDEAIDEEQRLTVDATSGTFRLRYFNAYGVGPFQQITAPIAFDAPAAGIRAALEGLAAFEPGDVQVSGGPGDEGGNNPYLVEFAGDYGDTAIPQLEVFEPALSGGAASASVATLQEGGSLEVCVPAEGDVCQAGQGGGYGAGQFAFGDLGGGVAVDGSGDVYAFEVTTGGRGEEKSYRVQKFSPEGEFLLTWGGEVNKTSGEDICTKADLEGGDVCGAGVPGTGPGEFTQYFGGTARIATDPEDHVFVGDKGRILEFDKEGNYLGEVALGGEGSRDGENRVRAMAMDGAGNFYLSYANSGALFQDEEYLRKFNPAGAEQLKLEVVDPSRVAIGSGGAIYTVENPYLGLGDPKILGFSPGGACFICPGEDFNAGGDADPRALATSTACGIPGEDLYASFGGGGESFLRAYGPPPDPDLCPPPEVPPAIADTHATSVDPDGAVVRARINPFFWPDARYRVQYGTGKCSEGGCEAEKPAPPGSLLTDEVVKAQVLTSGVFLSGLKPATTYRYRFVAESGGGGPVFGPEAQFTTFAPPAQPETDCPNQPFRGGPSAQLPDCRAYEMVSPVDKDGGDILALIDAEGAPMALNQSTPGGGKFTYSSWRAFAGAQSAPISAQYIATRADSGWQSTGIDAPRGPSLYEIIRTVTHKFRAFTPDLCQGWLIHESGDALAPGAVEGFPGLYRRDNCGSGAGTFEAITTAQPPNRPPAQYWPELQGVSADGDTAIFTANDKLTADAPEVGSAEKLLYESTGEGLRYVCVLPNGTPWDGACTAGTGALGTGAVPTGRLNSVGNAISDDGERIFWSDSEVGPGRLYVRIGGTETIRLNSQPAKFWGAAADGSAAAFTTGTLKGGEAILRRYDVEEEESETIAGAVSGVLGVSEDATRIYFASGHVLDEGATEGAPNLYLYDEGAIAFIGTLTDADAGGGDGEGPPTPLHATPGNHTAQVTPDGAHAVFMSRAALTGEDNTGEAGEALAEVFHYDASTDTLRCASCNPTGARPAGRDIGHAGFSLWAASRIPTAQTQAYPVPRVISGDGRRLFFESFQALVPADTNGKADVYVWQEPGKGRCTVAHSTFNAKAGGCVTLISSGESPADSWILDASASGNDVFFATTSSLLPQDTGLVDAYDARVGGGQPPPPEPGPPCVGDACQDIPAPPSDPTPASAAFRGQGNPPPARRGCAPAARRARRAVRGAKRARRAARKARRASSNPKRAKRMRRKAARRARRAKRLVKRARRCRARANRANRNKGGRR